MNNQTVVNAQWQQHRTFVMGNQWTKQSKSDKEYFDRKFKKKQSDPFVVLGVSRNEQYSVVKKTFLQLAMTHHPDTTTADSPEEEESNREIFISCRKAFEALIEGPEGIAVLRTEADEKWKEEDLNSWFRGETGGLDMPYMDPQTMREVAEMTKKVGGGLDRDGGMWTLARMVSNNVENGGTGDVLRLEAGERRDANINGILRRKRKR